MSAISTVYKRPSSVSTFIRDEDNRAVVYTGGLMTAFMWIIVGLASAANTEITPNVTGISVSMTVIDALVMVLVNLFLMRGIEKRNQYMVLPWIFISAWSMYTCHYKGIRKMMSLFKITKTTATLPWVVLSLNILALGLRVLLTLRIIHLTLNQWYQKKLEKEINVGL